MLPLPLPLPRALQVAERLEQAVEKVLDAGLRTGDIYRECDKDVKKVGCSEMGAALMALV
jgi:3-isopropylmalate dehydrogenase